MCGGWISPRACSRSNRVRWPHATKPLSDRRAAKLVHRSRFEPRRANHSATHAMPTPAQLRAFRAQSEMPYARYVTGHFTGTNTEYHARAVIARRATQRGRCGAYRMTVEARKRERPLRRFSRTSGATRGPQAA